jgi:hypothetical protein
MEREGGFGGAGEGGGVADLHVGAPHNITQSGGQVFGVERRRADLMRVEPVGGQRHEESTVGVQRHGEFGREIGASLRNRLLEAKDQLGKTTSTSDFARCPFVHMIEAVRGL